jgi:NAD(P)H dehydrogenase (quinone)
VRNSFIQMEEDVVRHVRCSHCSIRVWLTELMRRPMLATGVLFGMVGLFFVHVGCSQVSAQVPLQEDALQVLVTYHSLTGHTEEMAKSVAEGAQSISGTSVSLYKVGDVTAEVLLTSDALVVGSPVYWSNMSGEVKAFFDRWQFEFGIFPEFKMRNKVGGAFATGGQVSSGKEVTMVTILAAMLGNQMIVVSDGGAFGASATTEGESPGINATERAGARALGKRVAEVAWMVKRGQVLPAQP